MSLVKTVSSVVHGIQAIKEALKPSTNTTDADTYIATTNNGDNQGLNILSSLFGAVKDNNDKGDDSEGNNDKGYNSQILGLLSSLSGDGNDNSGLDLGSLLK